MQNVILVLLDDVSRFRPRREFPAGDGMMSDLVFGNRGESRSEVDRKG